MPVIDRAKDVVRNVDRLVRGCHVLRVPAILTEQYVRGLGGTVATVRKAFEETAGYRPIEKSCFSAYGCEAFAAQLAALAASTRPCGTCRRPGCRLRSSRMPFRRARRRTRRSRCGGWSATA